MVSYTILNMSHFNLSYKHIFRSNNHKGFQGVVHSSSNTPALSHCHRFRVTVTAVPLVDQISLTKTREEILNSLILPLVMGTPDTNGWGKKKLTHTKFLYLLQTKGQILVLICANRLQKLWRSWISSARVRPEFGSPTVLEYFILAASLTSGSWDCNQLRVIQSIWGSYLEGKFL